MLVRCYNKKYQEKFPTYKGCYVCERWLTLSNFIEDLPKIEGYKEWLKNSKICLDKDIKSGGNNKCYCLENCIFATQSANSIQAHKTQDFTYLHNRIGEKHPNYGKLGKDNSCSIMIAKMNGDMKIIDIFCGSQEASRFTGINQANINACCRFHQIGCDREKWFEFRKDNPRYKVGKKGQEKFVWKYLSDIEDNKIKEYIIDCKQFRIE